MEQEQHLQVCRAGCRRPCRGVFGLASVTFTEPLEPGKVVELGLLSSTHGAGQLLEVLGNGNLGVLNRDVVRAETAEGDRRGGVPVDDDKFRYP